MKKKTPPYAIIGAAILGIIAIGAFFQYQRTQAAKQAQAIADANAKAQQAIDAAKLGVAPKVDLGTVESRPVLYATQPIDPGVKISSAFYEKKLTPNEILPDAYTDQQDIVGWYAVRRIEKGDPLSPRNIGKTLPYLAQRIPMGMRSISLPVFNAENNSTGGFMVDGDKVDLLYTTLSANSAVIVKTEVVMQNLEILYVPGPQIKTDKTDGITPIPPPGGAIAVTFLVTPEQAEALTFMSQVRNGRFSMILRGRNDLTEVKYRSFDSDKYSGSWGKVQPMINKSKDRVRDLQEQIDQQAKNQSPGNNETTTPPTPKP